MPEKPALLDFFRFRFGKISCNHLLQSAMNAQKAGQSEKIVLACLLHDIANGVLIRADHGYWGAQLIAPYVDEEVAWAVQHHQALRFFPDPAVNYEYPAAYDNSSGRTMSCRIIWRRPTSRAQASLVHERARDHAL